MKILTRASAPNMSEKDPYGNKKKNENPENQSMSDANMGDTQGNRDNMRRGSSPGTRTQDMSDKTSNMQSSKKTMEQDEQEDEDQ